MAQKQNAVLAALIVEQTLNGKLHWHTSDDEQRFTTQLAGGIDVVLSHHIYDYEGHSLTLTLVGREGKVKLEASAELLDNLYRVLRSLPKSVLIERTLRALEQS